MSPLSNTFKRSGIFKDEFDKIFPDETFNKVHILRYITVCTGIVLKGVQERYPERGLRFINPLFIVDGEIFPASNLPGDDSVLQFARPVFDLLGSKTIISLSLPVVNNLLAGVCLFHGNTVGNNHYSLFKTFDLDMLPTVEAKSDEVRAEGITNEVRGMQIHVNSYPDSFLAFAHAMSAHTKEARIDLVKTLILYKSMSAAINDSLVFSFVNKFNPAPSFFDCILTFVSDQPFDEDELLDLAHITESMALPIATYDYSKSKPISAHTMAKRHSLREVLVESFRGVGVNI